jgi:hypothetical protein
MTNARKDAERVCTPNILHACNCSVACIDPSGRAQRSTLDVCLGVHVCLQPPDQIECVLRSMSEVLAEDPRPSLDGNFFAI